jgi:hypothetical protein
MTFMTVLLKAAFVRGGRRARQEHRANVYSALNLLAFNTIENFSKSLSGKVESDSKEIDAQTLREALSNGATGSFQHIENITSKISAGELPFTSAKGAEFALTVAFRAFENMKVHDHPMALFQAIFQESHQITRQLLNDTREAGSLAANLAREGTSAWRFTQYLRDHFPNTELLTVDAAGEALATPEDGGRMPNDFSGEFSLLIEWDDRGRLGGMARILNTVAACQEYGFNVGCAAMRKSAMIADRMTFGTPWADGGMMFDSPLTPATGEARMPRDHNLLHSTPLDLPPELAKLRLEQLQNSGRIDKEVGTARELQEILDAYEDDRNINYLQFRSCSIELPPAQLIIEGHTLKHLKRKLLDAEDRCRELAELSTRAPDIELKRQRAQLQVLELKYWISRHRDNRTAGPETCSGLR